jgi:hypothetical protein
MGRNSALINLLLPAFPLLMGLLVAVLFPHFHTLANAILLPIFVAVAGGVFVLVSKLPRFASGRWASFGAAGLPLWARFAYYFGYTLLACSVLAALVILVVVR